MVGICCFALIAAIVAVGRAGYGVGTIADLGVFLAGRSDE
jgi:hypothetical protein